MTRKGISSPDRAYLGELRTRTDKIKRCVNCNRVIRNKSQNKSDLCERCVWIKAKIKGEK